MPRRSTTPTADTMPTPDPLRAYSFAEVADRLSVGLSTVQRMVDEKQIKVFRPRGAGR